MRPLSRAKRLREFSGPRSLSGSRLFVCVSVFTFTICGKEKVRLSHKFIQGRYSQICSEICSIPGAGRRDSHACLSCCRCPESIVSCWGVREPAVTSSLTCMERIVRYFSFFLKLTPTKGFFTLRDSGYCPDPRQRNVAALFAACMNRISTGTRSSNSMR